MTARNLTLVIEQGATFSQAFGLGTDKNGRTCRAILRSSFLGYSIATFSCSVVATGVTTISLTSAITAALNAPLRSGLLEREVLYGTWELESTDGVTVDREYQGQVILSRRNTP